MMQIAFIFAVIAGIKAYLNFSKLLTAKRIRKAHERYIYNQDDAFIRCIPRAKQLLKDTNLDKRTMPAAEMIGYGSAVAFDALLFDNLDNRRFDVSTGISRTLNELVAVYKMRLMETISPRYWIEMLIFLPSKITQYLGITPDHIATKLLQLIYWCTIPVIAFFREQFYQFIITLIESL